MNQIYLERCVFLYSLVRIIYNNINPFAHTHIHNHIHTHTCKHFCKYVHTRTHLHKQDMHTYCHIICTHSCTQVYCTQRCNYLSTFAQTYMHAYAYIQFVHPPIPRTLNTPTHFFQYTDTYVHENKHNCTCNDMYTHFYVSLYSDIQM